MVTFEAAQSFLKDKNVAFVNNDFLAIGFNRIVRN